MLATVAWLSAYRDDVNVACNASEATRSSMRIQEEIGAKREVAVEHELTFSDYKFRLVDLSALCVRDMRVCA